MVDLDAALFHHLLEFSIADRIGDIPADTPKDHLTLKMAAFELNHRAVPLNPFSGIIPQASAMQSLRQNLLKAASHILAQSAPSDPEEFLEPDFAGMEAGAPPILIYSDSPQDAIDRLTNEVAAIAEQEQLPMSSLLVIHGNKVDAFTLFQKLGNRIGPDRIWWMNGKEHKKAPPKGYGQDYLRLARLETATGLEAAVVFLVGIEDLLSDADLPGLRDDEQASINQFIDWSTYSLTSLFVGDSLTT